ncbi:GGDEF domain-containing protein [Burkholderia guangdongensis]|uniref:GGDEF domain-containing protein n=1 Tax=Burkholderia guangdongensis TaxID=1792500 RepID=UPI0015CAECCC|nr:GGDEF domain-containing protein [Burkholderia guangdongensis]
MSTPAVLLLVLLVNCLLTSAALSSLLRTGVPGLHRWIAAQALLAVSVGATLAGARSPATITLDTVAYVFATCMILQGFRQFFDVRIAHRAEQVAAVLLIVALVRCTWFRPDPNLRAVLVSVLAVYVRVSIAWLAFRRRPRNRPAYACAFVCTVALGGAIAHFVRGVAFVRGAMADSGFMNATPANELFLAVGTLSLLGLSMGVVMQAHERVAERLERLATIDGLTGALMRSAFLERAQRHCRRVAHVPLSLVIVDLDHFKSINDRHGHACGDQALVRFAAVMSDGIRAGDLFGRLGGEEFAVLCPAASAEDARHAIDRLRASLADGVGAAARAGAVAFTFSAGVAERGADEPLSSLMARADAALYAAKAGGRDRVVVAPSVERADLAA